MSRADRLAKGIYWDRSWNCFTGCSPVGAGCDNCWARRTAEGRLRGRCGYPEDEPFRPTFHPERLDQVNSKQKPQVIALCFMSDPFHKAHRIEDKVSMLHTIVDCPQHTFIALTKRYEKMKDFLYSYTNIWLDGKPIPNLIGGVSVWGQPSADRMIPILLETNLATRILSLEPCLGMVDFEAIPIGPHGVRVTVLAPEDWGDCACPEWEENCRKKGGDGMLRGVDGVILGGESGPGARPMHPDIPRSVRDQCQAAGVPFFFKQHGEWLHESQYGLPGEELTRILTAPKYEWPDGTYSYRVGKKAAGRLLDGRTWDELPEVMK